MTDQSDVTFDKAVIIGSGLSAQIAMIVLRNVLPITHVMGPDLTEVAADDIPELTGKKSHSHIFLPRFYLELQKICPSLVSELTKEGLVYVPGSNFVKFWSPIFARRMFATRWQVENVVTRLYQSCATSTHCNDMCQTAVLDADNQTILRLDGLMSKLDISPRTLIIDASGAQSPLMKQLVRSELKISESSYIGYITQFFKQSDNLAKKLPDALYECAEDFGEAYLTLYPAAEGWFSVTFAYDIRDKEVRGKFRTTSDLIRYASQSKKVSKWLADAKPVGDTKTYMNPRMTWNVDAFASGTLPTNYVAIGDALVTTPPTFGAGCSFLTTHIRIIKDLLGAETPISAFQAAYAKDISSEQQSFFEKSRMAVLAKRQSSHAGAPSISKKVKALLRQVKPIRLALIYRGLKQSSSL